MYPDVFPGSGHRIPPPSPISKQNFAAFQYVFPEGPRALGRLETDQSNLLVKVPSAR